MFFCRVVEGAFQGPMLPATYSMMSKWFPKPEKPWLMSVISAGGMIGPVGGMLLSGALTSSFGWEVIFYVLGVVVVIWFGAWTFLCYSEPSQHPRISRVINNIELSIPYINMLHVS